MVSLTVTRRPFYKIISIFLAQQRIQKSYPVTGSLGNVFSDLLGRETQRTNLGSKSRGGTDLTTSGAEVAITCQLRVDQKAQFKNQPTSP